jgi:hypothetical protein
MAQPEVPAAGVGDASATSVGPNWDALLAGPGEAPHSVGANPDLDWDKLLGQPASPVAPGWDTADEALSGLTLGAGPYIKAAGRSVTSGKSYSAELKKTKADQASYLAENPLLGPAAGIVGSILPTAAATALQPELAGPAFLGKAAPLAGRVATMAAKGAESGVLQSGVTGGDVGENALFGAGVGAAFPLLGAGIKAGLKPVVDNGVAAAVKGAEALGLSVRPGQYAMPGILTKADSALMSGRDTPQLKQYTRVLSHAIGEDTDTLTEDVLDKATDRIGQSLDTVAAKSRMFLDPTLDNKLKDVMYKVTSASGVKPADVAKVKAAILDIRESSAFTPAKRTGVAFQQLTDKGSILSDLSNHPNATVRAAAGDLSDSLFETMARYSPPEQTKALFDLKDQFRNVQALRKPVEKAGASGLLNPRDVAAVRDATGDVKTLGKVGKFLPVPSASGASGSPVNHGFFPSWAKTGFSAAAGTAAIFEAKETAQMALAHPFATSAAAAAGIAALGVRPVARKVLGSAWLNNLALGRQAVNPIGASLALPAATGIVNQ